MRDSVDELLSQLTLQEKVALLAGADMWHTTPIERLGIPALKVTDGPHGARGSEGFTGAVTSACFPAEIALAASWNTALVERVGQALGQETRAKGAHVLLAPTVNIHRSPLAGRNFECFSEDPHLSARMAVAFITGVQSLGVGATVKHYVCNDSEFERYSISSEVSERALREIYLAPFKAAVQERSEEHTSELQSHSDLVCRLLLEKKNQYLRRPHHRGSGQHYAQLVAGDGTPHECRSPGESNIVNAPSHPLDPPQLACSGH